MEYQALVCSDLWTIGYAGKQLLFGHAEFYCTLKPMHFGQQDLKDLFIDEVAIKRKLSFQNDNPRKKVSYPLFNFQQKYFSVN